MKPTSTSLSRHAPHRAGRALAGHQFGGVAVDHVVDLQHQPLTHQELDLDAADGHPAGQLTCTVMTSGITTSRGAAGLLGLAALALLTFAFTGPADRGQRAHTLDSHVLVVAGQRLDGEGFSALRLALGARNRPLCPAQAPCRACCRLLVEVGAAVEVQLPGRRAWRVARWISGPDGGGAGRRASAGRPRSAGRPPSGRGLGRGDGAGSGRSRRAGRP